MLWQLEVITESDFLPSKALEPLSGKNLSEFLPMAVKKLDSLENGSLAKEESGVTGRYSRMHLG